MRRLSLAALVAAMLVVPTAGCGGGAGEIYETVSNGVLRAGDPVPHPANDPVLEIEGKIRTSNNDGVATNTKLSRNESGSLVLDLETLERLPLVRYSVEDPWLKREVTYTGVLVSDLVRLAGPVPGATTLHLLALDDYEVDIALADVDRWPIMLATQLDGQHMPVSKGGPTRIAFPYGLVGGIDELKYKDLWIWNIETITVR
jgi:hypothetical protein